MELLSREIQGPVHTLGELRALQEHHEQQFESGSSMRDPPSSICSGNSCRAGTTAPGPDSLSAPQLAARLLIRWQTALGSAPLPAQSGSARQTLFRATAATGHQRLAHSWDLLLIPEVLIPVLSKNLEKASCMVCGREKKSKAPSTNTSGKMQTPTLVYLH